MDKSVFELGAELMRVMRSLDDIRYPSLDNSARAYAFMYAMLATQIDFGYSKDEAIKVIEKKIAEFTQELSDLSATVGA